MTMRRTGRVRGEPISARGWTHCPGPRYGFRCEWDPEAEHIAIPRGTLEQLYAGQHVRFSGAPLLSLEMELVD